MMITWWVDAKIRLAEDSGSRRRDGETTNKNQPSKGWPAAGKQQTHTTI